MSPSRCLCLAIALAALLLVVACEEGERKELQIRVPPTPAPEVATVGHTLEGEGVAVTLNSIDAAFVSPDPFTQAKAGHHFLVVEVTIECISEDRLPYDASEFEIVLSEGYRYKSEAVVGNEPALGFGELGPGEKVRGRVAFQVHDGASGLQLLYVPRHRSVIGRWSLGI